MLPKVSFTDDQKDENGSKMLSRFGKMTKFNYPILSGIDPIQQHSKFLSNISRKDPLHADRVKEAEDEEQRKNILKENSMKTKTDLDAFLRRMTQEKAQIFTQKAMTVAKVQVSQIKKDERSRTHAPADGHGEQSGTIVTQNSLVNEDGEVDLEAQVEEAKKLLQSISMRNKQEETGGATGQVQVQKNSEEAAMGKTATQQKFFQGADKHAATPMKQIDYKLGKSPAFKALSRSDLHKIKGTRPRYEENFQNEFNRYNVKYSLQDPKIKGQANFDPPRSNPRAAHPNKLCHRGLTRLAEIALNVRKTVAADHNKSSLTRHRSSISNAGSLSARRIKVNSSTREIEAPYDTSNVNNSMLLHGQSNDSILSTQKKSMVIEQNYSQTNIPRLNDSKRFASQPQIPRDDSQEKQATSERKKKKLRLGINLLEAHTGQKEDFIQRASKSQLAKFVTDPVQVSRITEDYDYGSSSKLKLTTQKPGDIGTQKNCLVQFSKQKDRFDYKNDAEGAHEGRFETNPNSLESLSHHKKQKAVDFNRHSKRNMNVFAENMYLQRGLGRKLRPPSSQGVFYDNTATKDKLMKRTDKIVPVFDRQIARPSQVMSHDYPFEQVDTDPNSNKRRWVSKRSPQPVPIQKTKGREDNLIYRVSEGFNLEENDKTYFDKYNVMDLLDASRSLTSSKRYASTTSDASYRFRGTNSALNIIRRANEKALVQVEGAEDEIQRYGAQSVKRFKSVLDQQIGLKTKKDLELMSLEDRILNGIYKA